MDVAESQLITLGRLGAPYGIKGWMKLISFTDPPENILSYDLFKSKEGQIIEVDKSKAHGKGFVAHVKGCDDRDQTRHYTGKELQVESSSLPELEGDTYYWHQLEGLTVINLQEENLGKVQNLLETGANDVLVVRGSSGDSESVDEEERLIPYIRETVIKSVDLVKGIIQVDWEKDF